MKKIFVVVLFCLISTNVFANDGKRTGILAWWNKTSVENHTVAAKAIDGWHMVSIHVVSRFYDFGRKQIKSRTFFVKKDGKTVKFGSWAKWNEKGKLIKSGYKSWGEQIVCSACTTCTTKPAKMPSCKKDWYWRRAVEKIERIVTAKYQWGNARRTICKKGYAWVIKK